MALLNINFKSGLLKSTTQINIILPEKRIADVPLPVLFLLHGFSDNQNAWLSGTSLERYVRNRNIAVVMPSAFNSFYTNMQNGVFDFYSFFMEELIPFVHTSFNLSAKREDNFIAGLSMGGYGAFRIALLNPNLFSAAASFSGCLDITRLAKENDMSVVFGSNTENTENDLFYLVKKAFDLEKKPRLYQWCGTEDFLYKDNIKFRDYMKNMNFDYTYKESKGTHEWKYWDDQVRRIFVWLGINNNTEI